MNNKNLALKAPLSGPVMPLSRVPDPVFSSGTLGEGIAIDPLNDCLHAPCAGVVSHLARTRHALSLRADNGAELLLHVGLDTVQLQGEGFQPLVEEGARVIEGQPLLRFDLDRVARGSRSLITVMILSNGEGFQVRPLTTNPVEVGAPLLQLSSEKSEVRPAAASAATGETPQARGLARVAHHGGLHARPAALLRKTAQGFSSQAELHFAGQVASVDSLVGIMGLGVAEQDEVEVICRGDDSQAALDALLAALASGAPATASDASPRHAPPATPAEAAAAGTLAGVCAAPGLASGPLARLGAVNLPADGGPHRPEEQHIALDQALQRVRDDVQGNLQQARLRGDENEAAIFSAHLALLEDPGLLDAADMLIDQGVGAAHAWHRAIQAQCEILQALGNPFLAERANDLRDLEKRALRVLLGDAAQLQVPAGAIVVAHEFTPSDLGPLVEAGAAGLCMVEGGATSHVAILARSKGLPCLVALGPSLLGLEEGRPVVLDGEQARLELAPTPERLQQVAAEVRRRAQQRQRQQAEAQRQALTRDGRRIEVGANVASPQEAAEAFANGADGVGLLRTEFLFLERRAAPDEEEQRCAYQEVLDAMGERKAIIRTIDVGGDKQLDYLPLPAEENPALGLRGIRLGQARPELLDQQLRALLRVEPLQRCRILLPMVSEVDELLAIRQRLGELAAQLGIARLPELGVMIEVPSAALLADQLAEHADFLSIGTNDLSQYALAMDRCHAGLADRIDALHPALLRLIDQACAGAARHGRWVGVCGALASDPLATPVLVGLGVEELSVGPGLVGEIKARVRQLDASDCRHKARSLLELGSARAVREACLQHWPLA
ncbi:MULTISPECIES: phosphoenolpyruvate--protein phosphotransferase [Pseudomonas aeruginosa group]|uniref:phosphoenolpyruvate--protein phosphotransferase n=1 Tax=Pseudomonas aeruginosa group TaxID=136841 RepID=UPI00071B3DF6|nr:MULTISPECIES: phosphoenolpyruvate--protein phosphotransferase [Pseudomonas aeruginosa group]KSD70215.1 phosphoenolpyruvate--protein phosphotransferase [Pseudomonas aeruginosa]MCT9632263.1 phosphoenolpyruvate--protein phosphotransferase [Pseudomonas aeruginosa]MCW8033478.1 phosphoenolpyruvate--protein phosphotransferase [Pseudomonas aeruginosa]